MRKNLRFTSLVTGLLFIFSANVAVASPAFFIDTPATKTIVVPGASNAAVFPAFMSEFDVEKSISWVEDFCTDRKSYIFSSYKRSKKFYQKAVTVFNRYNVPAAFRVLLTIESDCNPNIISNAGAVGYWQFIDVAAEEYGLTIAHQLTPNEKEKLKKENPKADSIIKAIAKQRDDRKNFIKSTHAAAKYLRNSLKTFGGDLLLAAASYNCGSGNVKNAIYKSGETNATFWDIKPYLPKETQNYVMKFIALNVAFNNYEKLASNNISFEIKKKTEEKAAEENTVINTDPGTK